MEIERERERYTNLNSCSFN